MTTTGRYGGFGGFGGNVHPNAREMAVTVSRGRSRSSHQRHQTHHGGGPSAPPWPKRSLVLPGWLIGPVRSGRNQRLRPSRPEAFNVTEAFIRAVIYALLLAAFLLPGRAA